MSLTPIHAAAEIEAFIRREAAVADDDPHFTQQVNLFDTGYLDSLTVVALTVHIEECLGVTIGDTDLFDPRSATIEGMTDLITGPAPAGVTSTGRETPSVTCVSASAIRPSPRPGPTRTPQGWMHSARCASRAPVRNPLRLKHVCSISPLSSLTPVAPT
ncbi:acyl carrier protein [Streptomyces sp. ISL-98]|uniref:acyl carrier protein n=1 Tax=Streptomyces sp. ISL-98 TaxID=2819192 RepID=UPI001BE5E93C|nr:acyl carrier protein [Streptomyces sp. ISL-98]